jgi:hypothetical protein
MYNRLIQLNRQSARQRQDVFSELRQDISSWLTTHKRPQAELAKKAELSPQMLADVISGSRELSPETYGKLVMALKESVNLNKGCRIVKPQVLGQKVKKRLFIKPEKVRDAIEFNTKERAEKVMQTNQKRFES